MRKNVRNRTFCVRNRTVSTTKMLKKTSFGEVFNEKIFIIYRGSLLNHSTFY